MTDQANQHDPVYVEWVEAVKRYDTTASFASWAADRARTERTCVAIKMVGDYGIFTVERRTFVWVRDPSSREEIGDAAYPKTGIHEDLTAMGWVVDGAGHASWDFHIGDGPLAGEIINYC